MPATAAARARASARLQCCTSGVTGWTVAAISARAVTSSEPAGTFAGVTVGGSAGRIFSGTLPIAGPWLAKAAAGRVVRATPIIHLRTEPLLTSLGPLHAAVRPTGGIKAGAHHSAQAGPPS